MRAEMRVVLLLCGYILPLVIAQGEESSSIAAVTSPIDDAQQFKAQESPAPVSRAAADPGARTSTDAGMLTRQGETGEQNETSASPVPGRKQMQHSFSEPVMIAVVFGVMAGIIGTILLLFLCIKKLTTKKSSVDMQPTFQPDTDVPLNSVVTVLAEE
ncbi:uncharacterized protein RHO17_024090 [Thomomys bottae]